MYFKNFKHGIDNPQVINDIVWVYIKQNVMLEIIAHSSVLKFDKHFKYLIKIYIF